MTATTPKVRPISSNSSIANAIATAIATAIQTSQTATAIATAGATAEFSEFADAAIEINRREDHDDFYYDGASEEQIFALSPQVLRKWLASVTAKQTEGATIMPIITVEILK